MASLCLFLSSWLLLPIVHEVHALAADDSAGLLDSTHTHASASTHDAPCKDDDHGTSYPFVVDDAVVTGVASAEEQAAFDAGLPPPGWGTPGSLEHPQRSLLHGNRKPWKYSKCNRCTIVACNGARCNGHCKKSKKLFFCRSRRAFAFADCVPPEPEDLPTLSVDSLGDYDSAIITAPAPYIGCAEIEGKTATGCPERLTRTSLPGGGRVVVLESKCMAERYLPECPGPSPLYPYGICECRVMVTRPRLRIERGPCDFTLLSGGTGTIAPPRFSRAAADEVEVESDGDVVTTGFVDYVEEGQEPDFMHSRTMAVDGGDIDVKLEFFEVETRFVNPEDEDSVLEEEEDFAEEYDEVYGEDPDAGGGDGDSGSGSPGGSSTASSTSTSTRTSTTSSSSTSATARATVNGVSVRRSTSSSSKS